MVQKGQFISFITYEPNYPYRCYILSFMKIGWLIRNLRIGGGVGGNFFYFLGTAANLKGYWAFHITWRIHWYVFHFSTTNRLGGVPGQRKCHRLIWNLGVGEGSIYFFVTYEPNYPYRCYILSFIKIGPLKRKIRTGDKEFKYSKRRIFWCLNMSFNL